MAKWLVTRGMTKHLMARFGEMCAVGLLLALSAIQRQPLPLIEAIGMDPIGLFHNSTQGYHVVLVPVDMISYSTILSKIVA